MRVRRLNSKVLPQLLCFSLRQILLFDIFRHQAKARSVAACKTSRLVAFILISLADPGLAEPAMLCSNQTNRSRMSLARFSVDTAI
ncbi:hypothetical protein P152DRAFT_212738 [Eremomyces bilateralis CBS 781.70]|uniref:Uncharacterized protein n=1 Tax=Eremomyces bilateralis CBS 781.70 TaxID=1392243 RepID=A0A6G1FSM8_9PEZI|nr:uncharacterized protein P152DRAFT_212738 [Eremomyces bilateralis CBS 781.70]KAF1808718.1 hypothetical protein P152DRAFT_212738 [Eremomyces bilateralis CBS 781.70]